MAATRAVIWDFDGTLAYRDGMWSGCLIEVLDEHEPGHGVALEQLRPYLRAPRRRPGRRGHDVRCPRLEKPHPEAFARAIEACHGAERIVVVGDDPVADVGGAEAVGLPAILVRSAGGLPDLYAVERLL